MCCCAFLLNSGSVLIERMCGGRLLKVCEAKQSGDDWKREVLGTWSWKGVRCRSVRVVLVLGKEVFRRCLGAVSCASWKPRRAAWYCRLDSSDGCWIASRIASWSQCSNRGFLRMTLKARLWKRSRRSRRCAGSFGQATQPLPRGGCTDNSIELEPL